MQTEDTITDEAVRNIVTLLALAYERYAAEQREAIVTAMNPAREPLDKAGASSRHGQ